MNRRAESFEAKRFKASLNAKTNSNSTDTGLKNVGENTKRTCRAYLFFTLVCGRDA